MIFVKYSTYNKTMISRPRNCYLLIMWWMMYLSNILLILSIFQIEGYEAHTERVVQQDAENMGMELFPTGLNNIKDSTTVLGPNITCQRNTISPNSTSKNNQIHLNWNKTNTFGDTPVHPNKDNKTYENTTKAPWPKWKTLQIEDVKTDLDRIYLEKYPFLPPRSKDCDGMKVPGLDYTIVTALIDLRRENWPRFRRQFLKYCFYAVQVLNLHSPMVIFVDISAVDFVAYHRQGKEHLTRIIPVSIRDLEYYKYYEKIKEIMASDIFKQNHSMLHHPEAFSPDYDILMNSKHSMLYHASTRDYFHTNYFYWLDVGYGHGEDIFPKSCIWSPNLIMNNVNQITYIELNPLQYLKTIDDLYKKFLPAFLNGAFFGGPKISIKRYYFLHREVFLTFLDEFKVDDDQTLAVACYLKRPLLFNIVKGWWYDAFRLFG